MRCRAFFLARAVIKTEEDSGRCSGVVWDKYRFHILMVAGPSGPAWCTFGNTSVKVSQTL